MRKKYWRNTAVSFFRRWSTSQDVYMSALLAQQLDGRNLVIAPPQLLDRDQRGSWPNVFGDFQVRQTEFVSIGR